MRFLIRSLLTRFNIETTIQNHENITKFGCHVCPARACCSSHMPMSQVKSAGSVKQLSMSYSELLHTQ